MLHRHMTIPIEYPTQNRLEKWQAGADEPHEQRRRGLGAEVRALHVLAGRAAPAPEGAVPPGLSRADGRGLCA